MTPAAVTLLALKLSLALSVFVVGLQARPGDVAYLPRHPALWARSVLAMSVIMPLLVLWAATVFSLHPAVEVGLFALTLSPLPPFLPGKAIRTGGDSTYTISLVVLASALSIGIAPLGARLLGDLLGRHLSVAPSVILRIVGVGIGLPLLVGALAGRLAPTVATRAVRPLSRLSTGLLVVGLVPLLVDAWPAMRVLIGNGTLLGIIAVAIVGLVIGHRMGGPAPADRPVLALATASRHPAVAIAIAAAIFPGETLAPAAILLARRVGAIVSAPYVGRQRRHLPAPDLAPPVVRRSALEPNHQELPVGPNVRRRPPS